MTVFVSVWALAVLSFGLWWFLAERRWMKELLLEFETRFGGRCPVCALHRWGVLHGMELQSSSPPAHGFCPERRA